MSNSVIGIDPATFRIAGFPTTTLDGGETLNVSPLAYASTPGPRPARLDARVRALQPRDCVWWSSEHMIQQALGLSSRELEAVAGLEQRVVAADGGRLKLEWGVLRARSGLEVEDLLWWDGERLVGFLGLYAFGPATVEIAGMVDPDAR